MVAYDLMDDYDRNEVRLRSRRHDLSPVSQERRKAVIPPLAIQPGERLALTPTTDVILGDGVEMTRQHIADGEIDVAVIDVPFFLRVPPEENVVDYYLELNGEKPRFRADWDNFSSIQEYEEFCSAWIDEAMRCLNDQGSLFIHGVHHQHQHHRPPAPDAKVSGSTTKSPGSNGTLVPTSARGGYSTPTSRSSGP